jgi:hypothetical protein
MKSVNNRYRPPRMQYQVDDWNKKNVSIKNIGHKKRKKK